MTSPAVPELAGTEPAVPGLSRGLGSAIPDPDVSISLSGDWASFWRTLLMMVLAVCLAPWMVAAVVAGRGALRHVQ